MSEFNPDSFLNTETEESTESRYKPIPEGDYQALIDDVTAREAKDSQILDITYEIIDEPLKTLMDMNKVTIRQSIFLDIENGILAIGGNKNVKLGKLREALDQNQSGKPWSPLMMKGAGPVLIKTVQTPDEDDPEVIYSNVNRVTSV
jgi:hypothetical protein